ncbi:type 4a pilus biogenesis protein PilO [bacterium]|nr:type 4a pilus biogenesis protein PilO [bacterium]MBU1600011.1 type 4a pilus biogenesis protein PilO [bacterium]MBU2462284.1 type 4a pilus biogenesis protein PilO [bacterium]
MGKLTEQQKLYIIIAVAFIFSGVGFYKYSVTPDRIEIKRLEDDKRQKEQKFSEDSKIAARLPYVKAESVKLRKELEYSEKALPKEKDIPFLLSTLTKISEDNMISFNSFSLGGVTSQGDYSTLPITLGGIKTTYHNLAIFLSAIGNLPRLISPVNIQLTGVTTKFVQQEGGLEKKEEKEETVSVGLQLESYIYQ